MKRIEVFIIFFIVFLGFSEAQEDQRIQQIQERLTVFSETTPGLLEKVNLDVNNTQLPVFIASLGRETGVNIVVDNRVENKMLTYNLPDARLIDFIVYLCKEFNLTVDITGNIIALKNEPIKKQEKVQYVSRDIFTEYDPNSNLFSIDLQQDTLSVAFKKITDVTGKNLVYSPNLANKRISVYIKNKPFESAMEKLAFSNNLEVIKTKDDYYLFQGDYANTVAANNSGRRGNVSATPSQVQRPKRYRKSNFYFKVLDSINKTLEVDFDNVAIEDVIRDIGNDLNINSFTSIPLTNMGTVSMKTSEITYDDLLAKILEDSNFTFKKDDNIYYFGNDKNTSARSSVVIPLMHRSIEIMNQPVSSNRNRGFNSGSGFGFQGNGGGFNNNTFGNQGNVGFNQNGQNFGNNTSNSFQQQRRVNVSANQSFDTHQNKSDALINMLPKEVISDLEIKTDIELNAFIVSGDQQKINKLKKFLKKIDKPVPVVLIEVMILEVNKSNTLDTGVEFGVGDSPTKSTGDLFPSANVTLGASAINRLIGGFNGFGSLNAGRVVPNFFAKIKALETNGNVRVRSTPKLATLNGHSAMLSSGERSYYAVVRRDVIGTQNPQTSTIRNYVPIDADLSISIKPLVAGDDQITLSINVVQSSFNGERIDEEAPPGLNSREFTSALRVKDQDVVILGGLEENVKNDSGSGVPFLARIPVIKWLFSKRVRTASKSKLSVLIRPTILR
ncbi:type II secretion system protein GspD [Tenacibaculum agarivorans]|uniref:type II secretion system protein GspD n=1 Tax=Tenacibaculum agarivorans TaxID=1908389 RepID=UPI00094BB6A6|nr:hypothetical protein [Tenacibaculum agarivorans]